MPGRLTISGAAGTSHFELMFAESMTLMGVKEWVKQPFFSPSTTIRDLIKSVADKESVHSDPVYNETLVRAKLVKYFRDESHIPGIVAIGDYLSQRLQDAGMDSDESSTTAG